MLVFSTTAGDGGKNEVIGFLHVQEVVSDGWACEHCDVSGAVGNWVEEAGEVWSDRFMGKMSLYLKGERGKPRAMPTRVGLRGELERVAPKTLYIRRQCRHSDSGAHPITRAQLIRLVDEQQQQRGSVVAP